MKTLLSFLDYLDGNPEIQGTLHFVSIIIIVGTAWFLWHTHTTMNRQSNDLLDYKTRHPH